MICLPHLLTGRDYRSAPPHLALELFFDNMVLARSQKIKLALVAQVSQDLKSTPRPVAPAVYVFLLYSLSLLIKPNFLFILWPTSIAEVPGEKSPRRSPDSEFTTGPSLSLCLMKPSYLVFSSYLLLSFSATNTPLCLHSLPMILLLEEMEAIR